MLAAAILLAVFAIGLAVVSYVASAPRRAISEARRTLRVGTSLKEAEHHLKEYGVQSRGIAATSYESRFSVVKPAGILTGLVESDTHWDVRVDENGSIIEVKEEVFLTGL